MKYRVKGEVKGLTVNTEWLDCEKPEVQGVMVGLQVKGWKNCNIEEREE